MKTKHVAAIVILLAVIFFLMLEAQEFLHLDLWSR